MVPTNLTKRNHATAWLYLVLSGCFEVIWAFTMKLSNGFTDPLYTVITIIILAANLFLLETPIAVLGIGVSYGVFTGLGILGTSVVGIVALDESINLIKVLSIALLMIGVIGLKYCDAREAAQKAAQMIKNYSNTQLKEDDKQ